MDKEASLDLKQIIRLFKEKILIVVLIPMICVIISGWASIFVITPEYEAKTTIIIGRAPSNDKVIQYDDVLMYEKIIKTYSEIARSRLVAEKTLQKLNKNIPVGAFINKIDVGQEPETQIMTIRVKSQTAEEAMLLTNTVAEVFIVESQVLYPVASIQIIDRAYLPPTPVSPNLKLNIIIALFFGLIVSTGVIIILNHLDYPTKSIINYFKSDKNFKK